MQNILQADEGNRHIMTAVVSVILSAVLTPVYNLPLLVMQRNSPILLCFYLNELENPVDGGGLWKHSIFYYILLGFDCVWLYTVLTFVTFLGVIALNLLTGIPLILEILR